MRLTAHARKRWGERFPHLDFEQELASFRPAGKRLRRALLCRRASYMLDDPRSRRYLVNDAGVVLVVSEAGAVITVLSAADVKRQRRAATKQDHSNGRPRQKAVDQGDS